jgi:hypothetical protein
LRKTRKKVVKGTGGKNELGNLKNEGGRLEEEFFIGEKILLVSRGFLGKKGFIVRGIPGKEGFTAGEEALKEKVFLKKEYPVKRGVILPEKGSRAEEKKKETRTGGFSNPIQKYPPLLIIIAH